MIPHEYLKTVNMLEEITRDARINRSALEFICDTFIGQGVARAVFTYRLDKELVVKISTSRNYIQNIREFEFWRAISVYNPELCKKWLAPCIDISDDGLILIQKRTRPYPSTEGKKRPKKIPIFLTDTSPDNFGWIDDNYVAHDYGSLSGLMEYGVKTEAMKLRNI